MALYTPARILQPDGESLVRLHRNLELVDGSVVVNDPLHDAFICQEGRWYGPLGPGRYPINTGFGSFLNELRNFHTGGRLPGVSVFFVGKQMVPVPWGTGEVLCQEKVIGSLAIQIRVLAGGTAVLRVTDSTRFLTTLTGLREFDAPDFESGITAAILVPALRGALAKAMSRHSVLTLQADQEAITDQLQGTLAAKLAPMGLSLVELSVGSLSLHPDDLAKVQEIAAKRIDQAVDLEAQLNELNTLYGGKVYNRVAAQATLALASNPGMAGSPMSQLAMMPTVLGAANRLSGGLQDLVEDTMDQADLFRPRVNQACPSCGQPVNRRQGFCPHCGQALSQ